MQNNQIPFHIMSKPTGSRCNIDCDYCYFLYRDDQLYPEGLTPQISDKTLEAYIKNYIDSQPTQHIVFSWQGGEPTLLGIPFFEKVVALQKKHLPINKKVANDLQTNGILLNDQWCAFLKEHHFFIGISIDGPEEIHNHYRVSKAKKGTFKKVLSATDKLKEYGIPFATLTCITQYSAPKALEIYRFLRDTVNSPQIQLIPIVSQDDINPDPNIIAVNKTAFTVQPKQWGEALMAIFEEWSKYDIGKVFIPTFENYIGTILNYPSGSCINSKTCGQALAIMPNGDIFSCDHYIYDQYKLGNVNQQNLQDMIQQPQQKDFGESKYTTLSKTCLTCDYLKHCYGGCPKDRIKDQDGKTINYLCEGLIYFYQNSKQKINDIVKSMNLKSI
ncbi:anaerobic sulfatase maturase [Vibrio sp. SS-MA-C1-2]|uniref:anaerobic sulfatase maturase n=1 Tax=Vibrio sp. SS-MA-C1-2 TaxID=2908646 RepID=UPI001F17CD96|nr:anaerobic sulfatase maturase [Vibrio sp. SS-MA-C1-2]UJF17706.1 anaerobic sulfatase maturase [Vibrio sp. SS-MA-C1-2]